MYLIQKDMNILLFKSLYQVILHKVKRTNEEEAKKSIVAEDALRKNTELF